MYSYLDMCSRWLVSDVPLLSECAPGAIFVATWHMMFVSSVHVQPMLRGRLCNILCSSVI